MKAAVIDGFGGPEQLQVKDLPVPEPGPGQVRVRVEAAAVTSTDVATRMGWAITPDQARFPMLLGWEAAGLIDAAGPGAEEWQEGDPVVAFTPQMITQQGTYAELIIANVEGLARRPPDLDPVAASTIPLSGLTAVQALDAAGATEGTSLLVVGAIGAVGSLLAQLARERGVEVVASVGVADTDEAKRLGAAHTVDRAGDVAGAVRAVFPDGVDAAISLAPATAWPGALGAVRNAGRFITAVGGQPEPERGIEPAMIYVHPDPAALSLLVEQLASGAVDPRVESVLPLAEAADAHRLFESRKVRGRIVLVP